MNLSDDEYFQSLKNVFDLLPLLFTSDTSVGLTDTENFLIARQAEELSSSSESINESAEKLLVLAEKL